MMIAFPPCTYLTYAGMANWYDSGRAEKRIKAADFFMKLYNSSIQFICVENPRGIMSKIYRKPDQVIHPYYFGDPHLKRTCLWLKGLPKLNYKLENDLFGVATATPRPEPLRREVHKKNGRIKNRYFSDVRMKTGHERSRTFPSIAEAMAEQWTGFFTSL